MENPLTTVISCYSPTNVSDQEETDHRIISAEILLCLRSNKKKLCNNKPYDWNKLKQDINIRNKFVTEVKD